MANPTVLDFFNQVSNAKAQIDALYLKLRAVAPADLVMELDAAKAVLDAAFAGLDTASIAADITSVAKVVKKFGGPVGDGVNADLA